MENERFQLQNVAKTVENGSFQLQNAANSKENGQKKKIQKKTENNSFPKQFRTPLFMV